MWTRAASVDNTLGFVKPKSMYRHQHRRR